MLEGIAEIALTVLAVIATVAAFSFLVYLAVVTYRAQRVAVSRRWQGPVAPSAQATLSKRELTRSALPPRPATLGGPPSVVKP